jgi:hypothetical protein
MLLIVPISCFLLLFLIFQKSRNNSCWRSSFLSASLVWGFLVYAITEFLSIFKLIGFWEILGLWILNIAIGLICLIRINGSAKSFNIRLWFGGLSRFEFSLLAGIAIIIITVGVTGLISPPNNWDSMQYHMSRVVHWIQDRNVAYYPTNDLQQLFFAPWSEYAIMHFQILSGGDRFANLIQWFSMLGAALGVSLLAKQLGAGSRGQIFAAVICVTIPMGILQGSTTQNDLVVSFWLVCFTYYALLLKEKNSFFYSLATGLGLGLSILTKEIAYIYAFPFMAWISLSLVKSRHARGLLQIILIVIIAFIINFSHYIRNYDLFGNPLGPSQGNGYSLTNDVFTLSSVTSNVIRNLSLHIGTPFNRVNVFLTKGINKVYRVIGIDPNDKRTTWGGAKFSIGRLSLLEDTAGNPLDLILILLSIPILIHRQHTKKNTIYYCFCLVVGFFLFCAYLKWQPFNSRLQLPLFILWSSLIGLLLCNIRVHWIADLCIVILLCGAIPYLLYSKVRPILGPESIITSNRIELYFRDRPSIFKPYISSTEFLENTKCSDIGLMLPLNNYEYPFWVLLNKNNGRTVRFEYVNVTNISHILSSENPFKTFVPCAIIVLNFVPPNQVTVGNITYLRAWLSYPVGVFMQK